MLVLNGALRSVLDLHRSSGNFPLSHVVALLLRGGAVGRWGTVATVSAVTRRRFEMLDYAVSRGVNFIDTAEGTAVPV